MRIKNKKKDDIYFNESNNFHVFFLCICLYKWWHFFFFSSQLLLLRQAFFLLLIIFFDTQHLNRKQIFISKIWLNDAWFLPYLNLFFIFDESSFVRCVSAYQRHTYVILSSIINHTGTGIFNTIMIAKNLLKNQYTWAMEWNKRERQKRKKIIHTFSFRARHAAKFEMFALAVKFIFN